MSVAVTSPKSERYFLRVEGPIKEMDIAIYKWMNASVLSKRVIIGKSVNCDLQMSWDITSRIAPEQAEVKMINGYPYLIALEDGVIFDKKELKPNLKKRLYHGSKFLIGKTTFTYIEKICDTAPVEHAITQTVSCFEADSLFFVRTKGASFRNTTEALARAERDVFVFFY